MNDPLDPQDSNIHEIGYDAEDYTPFGDEYETLGHEYGRDYAHSDLDEDDSPGMGQDLPRRGSSRFACRYDIEKRASGLGHVVNEFINTVNPIHLQWNGPKDAQHFNDLVHNVVPHHGDDLANPAGQFFNEHVHPELDVPKLMVDTAAGYGLYKMQEKLRNRKNK